MTTIEIALWVITAIIVLVMIGRSLDIAVAGFRFWLRPNAWLLLRIPILLVALWCILGGVELVYDINARAWFSNFENGVGFRWWLLLLTPIVLSIASLGFTVPYLGYFLLVPYIHQSPRLSLVVRTLLSALVVITIPLLIYGVMYVL